MRGGGRPVWLPKGTFSVAIVVDRELGGPASNGVLNAFSQEPARGSSAGGGVWEVEAGGAINGPG